MDEVTLVRRACCLDRAAIGALYHCHVQAIYRYVYRRVSDTQLAEDLTAEVFVRAIEGLPGYEPGEAPFRSWLYRIAQARVADHFRRRGRVEIVGIEEGDWPSDQDPHPEQVERSFRHEELREAIQQLTPDQRQVIVLKFIQGLSNAEAARVLGKTQEAVKSLQHRALNALHGLLDPPDEDVGFQVRDVQLP